MTTENLIKANLARLDKALDRKYRFSHGIDTLRAMIEKGTFSHSEQAEVPSVKWNRRKFNRMNGYEQAEYERKLNIMKPQYQLFYKECPHGSFIVIPKMVYNWFNTNKKA